MLKNGFDFKVSDSIFDQNGSYIVLDLTVDGQRLTLVCLYGYYEDKPGLLSEILQKSAGFVYTLFLFGGDCNIVQNKSDDTYNVIHDRNRNPGKKIQKCKETLELLDPWHICYSVNKKYTWRLTSTMKQSRINNFLFTWVFALKFTDTINVLRNEITKIMHISMLRTLLSTAGLK
jgi:hypothetical protein